MNKAKLNPKLFDKDIEQIPTRNGYGEGLVRAGEKNENVVALCADLSDSTRSKMLKDKFPERFLQVGISEQSMASVAAGMAAMGKIPFISSYAMFSPGRNWEQVRTTICYNDSNVKIAGAHAGVSVGPDGATHQAIEDIAITRVLPNMTVVVPCDAVEARKATEAAAEIKGPVYLRFARENTPVMTTEETPFKVGKAEIFWSTPDVDVSIIACGPLVHNAILAAVELGKEGIKVEVINNHTIKPLDERTIIKSAQKTGAVVTVEEHQIACGMGSAIAELLAKKNPVPIEFIGVDDRFGESGEPNELIEEFGMGIGNIKEAVRKVLKRKKI
ncbi:transketolase family protein [Patescibacteria group bacterium]|nr:transketolase family protein [Patescibacteria group bacterium]MBU2633439.1 transketolase family protein [Patescibacteria group bacterium]